MGFLNGLVQKQRLANILDFGNGTLEVEGLGQHDLENLEQNVSQPGKAINFQGRRTNLLYIDAVAGAAED